MFFYPIARKVVYSCSFHFFFLY